MTHNGDYLNIQEAADALGVTRRRIWKMVKDGEIEAIGNPLDRREKLIPRKEVERLAQFVRRGKGATH